MSVTRNQLIIGIIAIIVLAGAAITGIILTSSSKEYMSEAIANIDNSLDSKGLEHGDTLEIIEKYQSVSITWESTDTIISDIGYVNASGLTSNVEVKIIVTFKEGDNEQTKDYFVTVFMEDETTPIIDCEANPNHPDCQEVITDPDEQKINLVKTHLVLPTTTMTDLELKTVDNGVAISWNSDNAAIASNGEITRSLTEDVSVTLTATLTSGDKTDTKSFTVIVKKVEVIDEAKDALILATEATENIDLPLTIGEDFVVSISWASDNAAITDTGIVSRSLTEDISVTLTATLTYNNETSTKDFTVIVLKDRTFDDVVNGLEVEETVIRDLVLRTSVNGVSISWTSSNESIIATNGEVTKPLTDTEVTLTATLNYNGSTETKTFTVNVLKEPANKLATPFGFVWIGDHNFFAYANITETGYSGTMTAIMEAPGEETIYFTQPSSGGNFSVLSILGELNYDKQYSITFIALGDGITWGDSDPSAPILHTFTVVPLEAIQNATITDDLLTWDSVLEAETYEVYSTIEGGAPVLLATLTKDDVLEVTLPSELGIYTIEIIAKAPIRGNATKELLYVKSADSLITLDTPTLSVDGSGIATWNAIANTTKYEVVAGPYSAVIEGTSVDVNTIIVEPNTYDITVRAIGDTVQYDSSPFSASVSYTATAPVPKVDNSGLLWQNNVGGNGHYSIERPAHFDPEGWDTYKFNVKIYDGNTLIGEKTFDEASSVIHIQVPGDASGMLHGLSAGNYEVHIVLIGNGTTHQDSEVKIFTINYAG